MVGSAIRAAREDQGITQKRLAELVDVSPAYVNDIEHSRRLLANRAMLSRFAAALGIRIEWFLFHAGLLPDFSVENVTQEKVLRAYQAFYGELDVTWPQDQKEAAR